MMLGTKMSEHYIFHYHIGSQAENDIDKIVQTQEVCFKYISNILKIKTLDRIEYYLCDSREEVGAFYGDDEPCSGFARKPNQVYAVYNEVMQCLGFHEDAHLISYQINTPKSVALREGLAMFFDKKWWGINNIEWVQYYLKTNQYQSIVKLIKDHYFYQIDCTISYPIMGFFTEYLILSYGMPQYIEFYSYKGEEISLHFESCYGKSLSNIEMEFIQYTQLFKTDDSVIQGIETLLKASKNE